MMELLFLVCWTGIFLLSGTLLWIRITTHTKVYLILILHFIFLTGIFYFYPLILRMKVNL